MLESVVYNQSFKADRFTQLALLLVDFPFKRGDSLFFEIWFKTVPIQTPYRANGKLMLAPDRNRNIKNKLLTNGLNELALPLL